MDLDSLSLGKLKLRKYQQCLYEHATHKNILVFLPTGTGKTLIAFCLMKDNLWKTNGLYPSCAQRIFFLAPGRILVKQQFEKAIKFKLFPDKISLITGDQNPDFWTEKQWQDILQQNHIFFMTPKILLDMLLRGLITMANICLIVFDEAHHAIKKKSKKSDHDYCRIMEFYKESKKKGKENLPKILGMTASIIPFKPSGNHSFQSSLNKIEDIFDAQVHSDNFDDYITQTKEIVIVYQSKHFFQNYKDIEFRELCRKFNNILNDDSSPEVRDILKPYRLALEKIQTTLYSNMGPWFAIELIELYISSIRNSSINCLKEINEILFYMKHLIWLNLNQNYSIKSLEDLSLIQNPLWISDRLHILIKLMENFRNHPITGIIFVQERTDANLIYRWLKRLSENGYPHIKPGFICGSLHKDFVKFDQPFEHYNYLSLMESGQINLLVATQAIEEGIDIPICNVIIRYDEPTTFRQYCQSRGRARDHNSIYFLMVAQDQQSEIAKTLKDFKKLDIYINQLKNYDLHVRNCDQYFHNIQDDDRDINEIGQFTNSTFTLKPSDSLRLLNNYLQKLSKDLYFEEQNFIPFVRTIDQKKEYAFVFVFPKNSPFSGTLIRGGYFASKKRARYHCAFRACIFLYEKRQIDEHLNIIDRHFIVEKHCMELNIRNNRNINCMKTTFYEKIFSEYFQVEHLKDRSKDPSPTSFNYYYLYVFEFENGPNNGIPSDQDQMESQFYRPHFIKTCSQNDTFCVNSTIGILLRMKNKSQTPMDEMVSHFFFNLFPIQFRLIPCGRYKFQDNDDESRLIRYFHNEHVFKLILSQYILDMNQPIQLNPSFYVVCVKPGSLNYKNYTIDFHIMRQLEKWDQSWTELCQHTDQESSDIETVPLIQKYEQHNEHSFFHIFTCVHKKPKELFFRKTDIEMYPDEFMENNKEKTFRQYYKEKYDRTLRKSPQSLSMIHSNHFRKFQDNFTLISKRCKEINKNVTQHQFFPREVIMVYPLESWLCLRIMALPVILYRLEQYCIGKQFLSSVSHFIDMNDYNRQVEPMAVALSTSTRFIDNLDNIPVKVISPENFHQQQIIKQNNICQALRKILPDDAYRQTKQQQQQQPNTVHFNQEQTYNLINSELLPKLSNLIKASALKQNDTFTDDTSSQCMTNKQQTINIEREDISYGKASMFIFRGSIEEFIKKERISFDTFDVIKCPHPWQVIYGLTLAKCQDLWNIERYETIGDSFIKMTTSLYLFCAYPNYSEYQLTSLKSKMISNENLLNIAIEKGIHEYLFTTLMPPIVGFFFTRFAFLNHDQNHQKNDYHNQLKPKDIADSVEALIGVFLIHGSAATALSFLDYLDLKAFAPNVMKKKIDERFTSQCQRNILYPVYEFRKHEEIDDEQISSRFLLLKINDKDEWVKYVQFSYDQAHLFNVENIVDYQFNNKYLLLSAFTHESYNPTLTNGKIVSNYIAAYQQLEFIGDAILDYLITMYIFVRDQSLQPGQITNLRSALVNNVFYAHILTKYELYHYIRYTSINLFESINRFILKFRNNSIQTLWTVLNNHNYIIDHQLKTNHDEIDEVDVPKALADVFEALIGAIYIDCGFKLDTVWKVLYKMIFIEINHFMRNKPEMPIQRLNRMYPKHKFHDLATNDSRTESTTFTKGQLKILSIKLTVDGFGTFEGRGQNKKQCRLSATNKFFNHLDKMQKNKLM